MSVINAKYLLNTINLNEFDLGTIKPPTIAELLDINNNLENALFYILKPFLYELNIPNPEIKFFDVLFINDEQVEEILKELIVSLQILYKTKDFKFHIDDETGMNILIADAKINRNNFDKLREIIYELFFLKKSQEEQEQRTIQVSEQNKHILEEYLRLEAQYKKEMEELKNKNKKTADQIMLIVASKCNWDYDKVFAMHYYQLITTYMSIVQIDNYETYLKFKSSGQFDMKNYNIKHWFETIGKFYEQGG